MECAMPTKKIATGDPVLTSVKDDKTATKASHNAKNVPATKPRRRGDSTKSSTSGKAAAKPATSDNADIADKARSDKLATKDSSTEKSNAESKAKRSETAVRANKEKGKLVRDSFTMPATEYALISQLKKRCLAKGVAAKKSEILRAAIASLAATSDANVLKAIKQLDIIKTGRPSKGKSGA
jgi:hypothetical protein